MNKQPVSYLQTDPRWAGLDYSAKGEKTTIGAAGCGPACAAMLIETLTGRTFTPADACAWALKKGYKAPNQGTYYSYFIPQLAAWGIPCERLNWVSLYGDSASAVHDRALGLLKQGYYLITCMGKGNWTRSGHYIVVWWEDGKVRINDPNSTRQAQTCGDLAAFRSQVKYYWAIDAREHNKEEPQVDEKETVSEWAKESWEKAVALSILDGTDPQAPLTREQAAVVLDRLGLLD